MKWTIICLAGAFALSLFVPSPGLASCLCNTEESGPLCADKYEASIWETFDRELIKKIKDGKICSVADLVGASQKGVFSIDYSPPCSVNGGGCTNIFAVSIPEVTPATAANWFIAAAACRNSGKRLLTNGEWQAAALGTPDPGASDNMTTQCNVGSSGAVAKTGARSDCVSDVGAHDMVGNVIEWVQDWGPLATTGTNWGVFSPEFGNDVSNMGGSPAGPIYGLPGGTIRGGSYRPGSGGQFERAGVYAIDQNGAPASFGDATAAGFRCGR